jgi:EamA domain-containing membrane protein RarD
VHVSMGKIIFSLWIKRSERQAENSPPSSAWFRMCGPITLLPLHVFMTWTDTNLPSSRGTSRLGVCYF